MKPVKFILAGVIAAAALSGCAGTAPVQNVSQSVVGAHTSQQVRQAILYAGLNRGWIMNQTAEGVIDGKILLRGHTAEIRITYNQNSYQINYVGSSNMDAKNGKIHSNYNRWVANLNKDIQLELARQNIS
ncbi:hypothetical protein V2T44_10015 [Serratia ficaria]|uniref:Lipoprotein n=1 Tax=Serratia ficaria TaxID=61651 RepID=A0A240B365_SERFI|nr:hypothetical protein [Serratia ficaria]MEE4483285.1 hypothetical protein [Serratia ficaria]REF46262.1 hypothetical protein C7332_4636 [Serratia ficaria]CAI0957115.1 Uncharacterised protein [Serratia ficaria]CAI0988789.1 Uncharacterised protein [Serratia ficaria]CAI1164014.1 Uncharacterised protein [Serratia ficaria]